MFFMTQNIYNSEIWFFRSVNAMCRDIIYSRYGIIEDLFSMSRFPWANSNYLLWFFYLQYTDDGSPRANRHGSQIDSFQLYSTSDWRTWDGFISSTQYTNWCVGCTSGIIYIHYEMNTCIYHNCSFFLMNIDTKVIKVDRSF